MYQLQSELKELSICEREITVTLPKDLVKQHVDKAYRKLSQTVKLKGFRPGKAPRDVLERYCGPQAQREALQSALEVSYQQALKDREMIPVSEPVLNPKTSFQPDSDFQFTIQFEVKPPVTIQKWQGFELSVPSFEVSQKDIDTQLTHLQQNYSTLQNVSDRTQIAMGDIVACGVQAVVDGEPNRQLPMLLQSVEMDSAKTLFPRVVEGLVGKNLQETIQMELELPLEFVVEALRGKMATLDITPTQIQIRQMPALDDEFAKDISDEFKTLDDLKERIQQVLTQEAQTKALQAKEQATIEALIAHNPVELPKKMVKKQAEFDVERFFTQFERGRAEELWKSLGEKLMEEALKPAASKVHLSLLCEQIAKEQGLEATEAELHRFLSEESKRLNVPKQNLNAEIARKRLGNEKALQLVMEKSHFVIAEPQP